MRHTTTIVTSLMTLALATGCDGPAGEPGPPGPPGGVDPQAPPLDKAFAGIGGRDALTALTGFEIATEGERLISLEGYLPEDDSRATGTFTAQIAVDAAGDRLRIDYHRTNTAFGGEFTYSAILADGVGVIAGVESVFGIPGGDLPSDRWAAIRREERLLDPHLILRELALGTRTATDAGLAVLDGVPYHRLEVADPVYPLSLYIDPHTGELAALRTIENDHVRGDSELEVDYVGWRTWDGAVKFPTEVAVTLGDQLVRVERRTQVTTAVTFDAARFAFPAGAAPQHDDTAAARGERNHEFLEGFGALGVPLEGLQTVVDAHAVAPGVWHLRGGSHHSLVIEQASGVVLVEAPLYEARAQAILDWIAVNIPGKPVTHVIVTHHHRDHSGGLRTLVAHGATVVVGAAGAPLLAESFRAPHAIEPDQLSAAPRAAIIDAVPAGGSRVLPDPVRPVAVYPVASGHAADMVIAYVPGPHVVFVSDLFSPGLPANFGPRELLDAIVARGLVVDAIAGGHGLGIGTLADLEAVAGP